MTARSRPLLFAHRGTRFMAPENTVAAFDFALRHGADVLETDVRLSADGEVMVTHDETLERTTDGSGKVRTLTAASLRKLDAGYRFRQAGGFAWRGRGLRLLTLGELFDRFGHVGINIDIKDKDPAAAAAVAGVIAEHLERREAPAGSDGHLACSPESANSAAPLINVGSFHQPVIEAFRQHALAVSTAAGLKEVASLYLPGWRRRLPSTGTALPFRYLQIPRHWHGMPLARPGFIERTQACGIGVVYWTINSPATMKKLLLRGADGIVTDRADLALPIFEDLRDRGGVS